VISTRTLFGRMHEPQLVGLDRSCDRDCPQQRGDCPRAAVIERCNKGPHQAELHCIKCDKHRGWAPVKALEAINKVRGIYAPLPPRPTLRDATINIGDQTVATKQYDNTNSGALFKNTDKEKDGDRDYSGTINIDGVEYWLSGWVKTSKAGKKFLSITVKPKQDTAAAKAADKRAAADELARDEIPW
jgi:hypothetical protein